MGNSLKYKIGADTGRIKLINLFFFTQRKFNGLMHLYTLQDQSRGRELIMNCE